jgi:hypothetical protein
MFVLMSCSDAIGAPAGLDHRVERCRRVVDVLTEVGMKLVRTLDPQRGPASVRDPIAAYCRLSRALRLTLLLEARLEALARGGAAAMTAERRLAAGAPEGAPQDAEAVEAVEAVEHAEADDAEARRERDREGPDEIDRFLARPLTEVAAAVCRDLGLSSAEAHEAEAAFAELTANDDAGSRHDEPESVALVAAGRRDLRRPAWAAGRAARHPP